PHPPRSPPLPARDVASVRAYDRLPRSGFARALTSTVFSDRAAPSLPIREPGEGLPFSPISRYLAERCQSGRRRDHGLPQFFSFCATCRSGSFSSAGRLGSICLTCLMSRSPLTKVQFFP